MSEYSYDESGLYAGYFTLTFLFIILLPLTISTIINLFSESSTVHGINYPGYPYPKNSPKPKTSRKSKITFKRFLTLLLGWSLFILISVKVKNIKLNHEVYNPFEILGLSSSSNQKQIRKHYKKLSLKFHPDKVKLAINQTREEADNFFVSLTKAYKSLTDEQTRQNLEQFGHPDGKQQLSLGIAIPTWVVDSKNGLYVLALYGLLFGGGLPFVVGRWWFNSRSLTKDKVLNSTAATFFKNIDQSFDFTQLLQLNSTADEFLNILPNQLPPNDLLDKIKSILKQRFNYEFHTNGLYGRKQSIRAATLLFAHVLKIDLPKNLKSELISILPISIHVNKTLLAISISHNWLNTTVKITELSSHLLTATAPNDSIYKSIHNFPSKLADELSDKTPFTLARATEDERRSLLKVGKDGGVKEEDYEGIKDVIGRLCHVDIAKCTFEVVDEQTVTPGAIVQFKTQARLVPSRFPLEDDKKQPESDELIEKTDEKLTAAYTPYYPQERPQTYLVMLTDAKTSKIIVQPGRFSNIPVVKKPSLKNYVKSLNLQFQAPPQPGVYTFRALVISESQMGWGHQSSHTMRLLVEKPQPVNQPNEDDISDPEEDSLAGQMAQLRGQNVKKAQTNESSDEESESESEDDDQKSDNGSSSDSD